MDDLGKNDKRGVEATVVGDAGPTGSSLEGRGAPSKEHPDTVSEGPRHLKGSGELVFARLGDRLIAIVLDTVLLGSFFAFIGMYSASKWGGMTEQGFSLEGKPALISMAAALVFGFAYHWLLEGLAGATLGKLIMGLRVRGTMGKSCGLKASLVRNLLRIVDGLAVYLVGLLVALFSKRRQRIGDHLGGTVVVEHPTPTALRVVGVLLWFGAVGSGIWFSYTIHREATLAGPARSGAAVGAVTQERETSGVKSRDLQATHVPQASEALSVVNLALLEKEGGSERPGVSFKPGQKLYARFQVVGFGTDSQGEAKLFFDVVALDPEGLRLYENWKPTFQGAPRSPKDPIPATMELDIPEFAPEGTYRLIIKVKDAVKGVDTELVREFPVGPTQAVVPKGLEVRDFVFSASEDGPPLARAQVQGGDRLYMAFKVAGIVFRDDRPALSVDMQVLDPDGDLVLNQPRIVQVRDPLVYHPATFFARVTSWVDFPDEAPKGVYTARFLLLDENSGNKLAHEARFEVK